MCGCVVPSAVRLNYAKIMQVSSQPVQIPSLLAY